LRTNTDRRGRGLGCNALRYSTHAVAAVEFALIAPVLVIFMLGLFDLSNGITTWWHLTEAAHAVAQIATVSAAQPDQSNQITATQVNTAATAAYPLVPQLATASSAIFGVTLTSVVFTAGTGANCANGYCANVAWSMTPQGTAPSRSCGTLQPVADATAPSKTTLPSDAFSAAPLLVVDVFYKFTPLFTRFITSSISMMRTAYLSPRTGTNSQWTTLVNPPSTTVLCPGYGG
jgi:Flp pilus assembly protein TadG